MKDGDLAQDEHKKDRQAPSIKGTGYKIREQAGQAVSYYKATE